MPQETRQHQLVSWRGAACERGRRLTRSYPPLSQARIAQVEASLPEGTSEEERAKALVKSRREDYKRRTEEDEVFAAESSGYDSRYRTAKSYAFADREMAGLQGWHSLRRAAR